MSNQYKDQLQNLSEQIFEIRGKCSDQEYKNLMDSLKKLYDQQDEEIGQPVFQPSDRPQLEVLDEDQVNHNNFENRQRPEIEQLDPLEADLQAAQNSRNLQIQYKYKNVIHSISCDNCRKGPIVGIRYNCKDCTFNYDLCQACFDKQKHSNFHQHKYNRFGAVVKPQKINTDCCTIM